MLIKKQSAFIIVNELIFYYKICTIGLCENIKLANQHFNFPQY